MSHLMAREESYDARLEKLKGAFHVFDRDSDGTITFAELRNIMINLGEKVEVEDIDEVIRRVSATPVLSQRPVAHPTPTQPTLSLTPTRPQP